MRARYYNVDIKRFMNQDVIVGSVENSPSLNRYAYVEGNPVNYLDPFGLEKGHFEHDEWHTILGNIGYISSLLWIYTLLVYPPLAIIPDSISFIVTDSDFALHALELIQYSPESRHYLIHFWYMIVDGLQLIPFIGNLFTVGFFISDKIENEQSGKGIVEKNVDDYLELKRINESLERYELNYKVEFNLIELFKYIQNPEGYKFKFYFDDEGVNY